jgi:RNA polymerase sigma-70 factor (ECF subfamily)
MEQLGNANYFADNNTNSFELQIIVAAKQDNQAFEAIYNLYFEKVFLFVYQRMDSKEDALDVTQSVFLKAMEKINQFEYRGIPLSAWLLRIAYNELIDVFRAEKKGRAVNVELRNLNDLSEDLEINKIELYHDKIVEMISTVLNDDELTLIEMRFFEKRSFKEIADILEITENNAKVKAYRVIDKIKSKIKFKIE